MNAAVPTRRRLFRRPTRRTAVIVIAIALLVGVPSGFKTYSVFRDSLDGPAVRAPGTTRVHLETGRWMIYEAIGTQRSAGPVNFTSSRGFTIGPGNVTVRDETGLDFPIDFVSGVQTITLGSDIFTAAVEFRVPRDSDYAIEIHNDATVDAMVARPVSDTIGSIVRWAIPTGLAAIALILGVVFALVPARGDGPRPSSPAFGPPPGWYPDQFGTLRWWDGRQWTAHVQPR